MRSGSDAALDRTLRDRAGGDHDFGRAQDVIVERLELRMMPEPAGIASRHARDVGHACHLRSKMPGHAVWLQVMRIDDVERAFGMHARGDGGKLGDERARHRNVGLRAVDRVGPVHRHRARVVSSLAALPILRPHVHAERRAHLLCIGDDVNVVPACGKRMRGPVGAHADAALDRRELADDADSQPAHLEQPVLGQLGDRRPGSARRFAERGRIGPIVERGEQIEDGRGAARIPAGSRRRPGDMATASGVSRLAGTGLAASVFENRPDIVGATQQNDAGVAADATPRRALRGHLSASDPRSSTRARTVAHASSQAATSGKYGGLGRRRCQRADEKVVKLPRIRRAGRCPLAGQVSTKSRTIAVLSLPEQFERLGEDRDDLLHALLVREARLEAKQVDVNPVQRRIDGRRRRLSPNMAAPLVR